MQLLCVSDACFRLVFAVAFFDLYALHQIAV
jgi:hypothetical protein